jgi:hypothetical protein
MKKMKFTYLLLTLSAGFMLYGLQSCKALEETKESFTSAEDFTTAETVFAGTFDMADDINQSDGKIKKGSSTILPSGAIFTWVDSVMDSDGIKYTLDFGSLGSSTPKGLLCGDGKYRAGKIHISVSKPYMQVGTTAAVKAETADNYYIGNGIDMFRVEGNLSITRSASDSLDIVMTGGKVSNDAGKTALFQGTKAIKRLSDGGVVGIWGDIYQVTGNGGGTNVNGENYTWKISTPLLKNMKVGCSRTFVKGVIEVKNDNVTNALIVDFDPYTNEACDLFARVTYGSQSRIITVR